VDYPLY
jgi:hypothetical protein